MSKRNKEREGDLPEPGKKEIKNALEKSGYLLEQRICPILDKYAFYTIPNEQYQDQDTGESREIDIFAIYMNPLYRSDFSDTFEVRLVVECKNNKTPVVFMSQENPIPESLSGWILVNGYPDGIYEKKYEEVTSIEDYFHFKKFHHNYKVKWISRQFCQLKPKIINKGSSNEEIKWESTHETLYESIEKLVKAAEYFSSDIKNSISLEEDTKDFIHLGIVYPILLFSGQMYECRIQGKMYNSNTSCEKESTFANNYF